MSICKNKLLIPQYLTAMNISTDKLHFWSNTVNPQEDYMYSITYSDFKEIMCGDYVIPAYLYKDLFNIVSADATKDNFQAQFFLSLLLRRGYGCVIDVERADYWLNKAFNASNFYALLYVFRYTFPFQVRGLLFWNETIKEDKAYIAAKKLYDKYNFAIPLALCYQYGIGCDANESYSISLYKEAYLNFEYLDCSWIKPFDEISKYYRNCGSFKQSESSYFYDENGIKKDIKYQVDYLQNKANEDDEFAMLLLAEYYEEEHRRKLWEEQILKLIDKNFVPAYFKMGYYLVQEVSWKYRDNKKAIIYLEKSVELCPRNVFYREFLAHCYAYKTTNMLNPQKAIELYKSIGIGSSRRNTEELISKYYHCGGFGFRDYYTNKSEEEKRQGLIALANSNDPYAQYYLGMLLLKENPNNYSEPISLLVKSYNNGYKKACEPLIEFLIKKGKCMKALSLLKKVEDCNYYPYSIKEIILDVPMLKSHVSSLYSYQHDY